MKPFGTPSRSRLLAVAALVICGGWPTLAPAQLPVPPGFYTPQFDNQWAPSPSFLRPQFRAPWTGSPQFSFDEMYMRPDNIRPVPPHQQGFRFETTILGYGMTAGSDTVPWTRNTASGSSSDLSNPLDIHSRPNETGVGQVYNVSQQMMGGRPAAGPTTSGATAAWMKQPVMSTRRRPLGW